MASDCHRKRSAGRKAKAGEADSSTTTETADRLASQVLSDGEDKEAFLTLFNAIRESLRPASRSEEILIESIVANSWRLLRVDRGRYS